MSLTSVTVHQRPYTYHVSGITESASVPSRLAAAASAPPPIPSAHLNADWLPAVHLLLWVHTGAATVELADGQRHRLAVGEGIWIPVGGLRHAATDPGGVMIPYWVHPELAPDAPAGPKRFAVQQEWRDWLIMHYAHQVAPINSLGHTRTAVLDILDPALPSAPAPAVLADDRWPPMPRTPGARTVAAELCRDPSLDRSIEEWSTLTACSVSTLRRAFRDEAGMTYTEWRSRCRLAAGREFVAAGFRIDAVAALVGFSSRSTFTRAFRARFGFTPSDYTSRLAIRNQEPSDRVLTARGSKMFAEIVGGQSTTASTFAQERLPASSTLRHANDGHVLVWMYRGCGWLRTDDGDYQRRTGDAIWIPAGLAHSAGNLNGAIGLPIGDLMRHDAPITTPIQAHFPPAWDAYLLHRSVSARTRLRPDGFDPQEISDLFRERFAARRAGQLPMPTDERTRAIAERFLQQMRLPAGSDPDAAVFKRQTGMTFVAWCHAARMHTARGLLRRDAQCRRASCRLHPGLELQPRIQPLPWSLAPGVPAQSTCDLTRWPPSPL